MPTYEYRCDKCGEQFELFQSFQARPLRRHAACGGSVQKIFHPRGVTFKGSGFYATDSRTNGSDSGSNGDSSEGSSSSEKSKSKGSESKSSDSKGAASKSPASKSSDQKASDTKLESRSS